MLPDDSAVASIVPSGAGSAMAPTSGGAHSRRVPYLRITGPVLHAERRVAVAARLTDAVVELFTPPRGPSADDIRSRTTVHFTSYSSDELFVGGRAARGEDPDVTVELSDWLMSTRQQSRAAAALSPLVGELYGANRDAV